MGSHGWGALKRVVLGSVTQRVLAHARIPVLVYR
jgi:nucleotide-binding universal stress UspA family protein